MGLYKSVVTYFFLNLCVEERTRRSSLMAWAYRWLSITWLGSSSSTGSGW